MDQALTESIATSLKELAARGGRDALHDERRVRGKLADSHPKDVAARNILVEALKTGVPGRLAEADPALLASVVKRESDKLCRQFGADSTIARGAVTAWALALELPVSADSAERVDQVPPAGMIRCAEGHVFDSSLGRCPVCGWQAPGTGKLLARHWTQSLVFSEPLKAAGAAKPMQLGMAGAVAAAIIGVIVYAVWPSPPPKPADNKPTNSDVVPPKPAIPPPPKPAEAKNLADELTDWGVPQQSTLQRNVGFYTPVNLPGARRITTDEVQHIGEQSLLIDVLDETNGHLTIPRAVHIPGAGNFGAGRFDDRLQKTLSSLLAKLTNTNLDQQIVFFCEGAQCWESYNAALRALNMGYHNVLWYRGGLASWKAANLPVAAPAEIYSVN
jgi:PQQ-dependent catabolism-associated CXXCW motif protein